MAPSDKTDLKVIYDKILTDEKQQGDLTLHNGKKPKSKKQKAQAVSKKQKVNIPPKKVLENIFAFIKVNYISVELMFAGFVLICLGFLPAIKIISYQFLETLNVSVSYFNIAGWLFSYNALSAENVFLSVFAGLYILSAMAMIVIGALMLLGVLKKKQFMINSLMHLIALVMIMCFFVSFAVWASVANDANLIATGIDIIYYNFSTSKIYTLIYFNLSFGMIAYTVLYAYHYRQNIFPKKKK